jgi:hypothetical protein
MNEDDKLIFEQLRETWLHFATWRERIFAGYLTVLAALAYAFSKNASIPIRSAVFAFGILVSAVFRILDIRTTGQINLCQRVGRNLFDSRGFYAAIDKDRFMAWRVMTYGFAINMLVAGIVGPSIVGLVIYILKWRAMPNYLVVCWWWSVIAFLSWILALLIAECFTSKIWKRERAEYRQEQQ